MRQSFGLIELQNCVLTSHVIRCSLVSPRQLLLYYHVLWVLKY